MIDPNPATGTQPIDTLGRRAGAALAALPLASLLLDERLRVLAANQRLLELVGRDALAAPAMALDDLLVLADPADDEDDADAAASARLRALAAGQDARFELAVRDAAGEPAAMRAHAVRLDVDALAFAEVPQAAYLIQLDPIGLPAAGRSATAAQPLAWYRALFLESPLPKLLMDEDYRIVDANDAALELTGYRLAELLWTDPAALLADEAARERLLRERRLADPVDPIREAMAYPLCLADGRIEPIDAVVARPAAQDAVQALQVATLLPRLEEATSEQGARWRERFLATIRDEQRMLPTAGIGAAVVRDGLIAQATASFVRFFELDSPSPALPLERLAGRRTALALEEAAGSLDDTARHPYERLPVVEFVWTGTSGRPASFVAMARRLEPEGEPAALLVTVVDTSGRDADVAERLRQLAESRDALLRQVHRQVGANLDGLAALVRAEAQWNPQAADPLERIAARLRVAAHIEGLQPQDYGKAPQPVAQLVAGIAGALQRHFGASVSFEAAHTPDMPPRWVARNERLAVALACNELITNAIRHRADAAGEVRVSVRVQPQTVAIEVRNPGALAPAAPDASAPPVDGQGAQLLRRLLPTQGARFSLEQHDGEVVGRIVLEPPAIY